MKAVVPVLFMFISADALALPAEDHWSADMDTPLAESYAKAAAMVEAEYYEGALPILQQLAKEAAGNADVFNLLGFSYRKTGDLVRSAEAYERALFLKPDHLGALEYQGELFLTQGKITAAEANLARLEALCPVSCEERSELEAAIEFWRETTSQAD